MKIERSEENKIKITKSKTKYTQEQIDEVIRLKKQFVTNQEISEKTGVSLYKIKMIVRENDLFLSEEQTIKNTQAGRAKQRKKHKLNIKGDPLPESQWILPEYAKAHIDKVPDIIILVEQGHNIREICSKLGIYDKVVRELSKEFGITLVKRTQFKTKEKTDQFIQLLRDGLSIKKARVHLNINHKKARSVAIENGFTPLRPDQNPKRLKSKDIDERLPDNLDLVSYEKGSYILECTRCGQKFTRSAYYLSGSCSNCSLVYGRAQNEISEWISSVLPNKEILNNTRSVIPPKELDIYIPELNLAIEYCGLYWHTEDSPEPRKNNYHKDKMLEANAKGIRLITIFEDEWLQRKSQVKNFLKSVLGVCDHRVFARKCDLCHVGSKEAKAFLDQNHIQGGFPSKVAFGLYSEGELIGVVTGNKHHRNLKGKSCVLNRLAFKDGTQIIGGASKLLKQLMRWAKRNGYEEIVSWSDNRWSEGNVYEKMEFLKDQELRPDYSYVKENKRYSKQSLKKTEEERKTGLTERELRIAQGYSRIWDCGKKRWVLSL